MTSVVDRGTTGAEIPSRESWPGELSPGAIDRTIDGLIVVFLGFLVPLVSLFRGHWLEYFLPVGLALSFLHLLRHGVLWRDYFHVVPRIAFFSVGAFILLGFLAALRVFDADEPYENLRAFVAPLVVYLAFYGVIFFVMIRGSALAARILKGLLWGTVLAFAILALEPFTGIASEWIYPVAQKTKPFSLAHFNRTLLALAMLSWLAAPWITRRFGHAGLAVVPPLAVWLLNFTGESDTVTLGLVPAVAVYFLALWRPRWVLNAGFIFTILLLLSAPVLYPVIFDLAKNLGENDRFGFLFRAEIWDAVALFISKAPIFGHGMQSTLRFSPLEIANLFFPDKLIYHPHNAFLQVWADMGLAGALAMAGMLGAMWRGLANVGDDRLPHILAMFSFAIAAFVTTHSLWAAWWLGLLAMVTAYAIASSGTIAHRQTGTAGGPEAGAAR